MYLVFCVYDFLFEFGIMEQRKKKGADGLPFMFNRIVYAAHVNEKSRTCEIRWHTRAADEQSQGLSFGEAVARFAIWRSSRKVCHLEKQS